MMGKSEHSLSFRSEKRGLSKMLHRHIFPYWRSFVIVLTPLILSPIAIHGGSKAARCGFSVILMAIFWMTECVPLGVTSLLPIVLYPVFGVMRADEVSVQYLTKTNFLFLSGLMVACAVEHSGLHQRIALKVLLVVGNSPRMLMFGFMITTMFLSMWISNTATTAMMVPIVDVLMKELYRDEKPSNQNGAAKDTFLTHALNSPKSEVSIVGSTNSEIELIQSCNNKYGDVIFKPSSDENKIKQRHPDDTDPEIKTKINFMLIAVAYAANLGGIGTMTGSGTNLVVIQFVEDIFKGKAPVNFGTWMAFGTPTMFVCMLAAWIYLQILFLRGSKLTKDEETKRNMAVKNIIKQKYTALGSIKFHEWVVLILFTILVFIWIFREPQFIPGWNQYFEPKYMEDCVPTVAVVFLLFAIPAKPRFWCLGRSNSWDEDESRVSPGCLTWKVIHEKLPWNVILLLGGGFAMAEGAKKSGLSDWITVELNTVLNGLPSLWLVVAVTCITGFATEVASNTATATILMPVLAKLSMSLCIHPLYLMLPAAIACSFAFMLPIATPPNAIVYAAGNMRTLDMALPGFVMNLMSLSILLISINTIGSGIFNLQEYPEWANLNGTMC